MTREHVVISFDAVFKKVSRTDADCHRQHRPIPNCVAGFCFDPFYTAWCVTAKKNWRALYVLNLITACIAMVNKCWMAALALGVKTKAVLSVLKCEWRREFQSHVLAVELSEVWEVLSVELISLDMRYRLAEWKRLWWTVCNKPWWPPANPHTAAPSYQSTANEWNSAQSPLSTCSGHVKCKNQRLREASLDHLCLTCGVKKLIHYFVRLCLFLHY